MKKHLSSFLFGFLGLGAGFILCYVYLVLPARATKPAPSSEPQLVMRLTHGDQPRFDRRQPLIQPMLPPRIIGH